MAAAGTGGVPRAGRRLLVVSHPAVVGVNQLVYRELARRGWQPTVLVPASWRSEYSGERFAPQAVEGLEDALRPTPVLLAGRAQRHVYLTLPGRVVRRVRPDVAFLEAEPFSIPAAQWCGCLRRRGIPFGVQCAENIDRALPAPIRASRTRVLRAASFVAARSETAGRLARDWGACGEVALAPHAVPGWEVARDAREDGPFTIGYAGRLVPSKGLDDLLAAVRRMRAPVHLRLIGDGELRGRLEGQPIPGSQVEVLAGVGHDQMGEQLARLDVLALPSRTTPTWKEQFGRVVVEALWCGVPVVGSDSGEIPWLIGLTGGGATFPEGDDAALAAELGRLRDDPQLRARLAHDGREVVERRFSVAAATDALEALLTSALPRG